MSAVSKINSSGLTPEEKRDLKVLIANKARLENLIAEDNQIDDELLRKYLTGQTGNDPPVSPRFFESCFIIVDGLDVVAGSAFAVSPSLMLSAMHIFEDDVEFFACKEVRRSKDGSVTYPEGKFKVEVVAKGDANVDELDYVVLQLSDVTLRQLKFLPIATRVEKGDHVRLYCAFNPPGFNEFSQDFCNVAIETVQLISTISGSHIYCSKGTEDGSSGGPYVNVRGEVVAIHTTASNNIPDIEKPDPPRLTRKRKTPAKIDDVDAKVVAVATKVVELCDVVSKVSNTHTSRSIGLMIKSCPHLCEFLRLHGVIV